MTTSRQPGTEAFTFAKTVGDVLHEAVAQVVENHRRTGRPLVISRNGKVVFLPPDQAQSAAVHEPRAEYRTGDRDEGD